MSIFHRPTDTPDDDLTAALNAGYWYREEPHGSLYGPWIYGRPGTCRGTNAPDSDTARTRLVAMYRADCAERATAEAEFAQSAAEAAERDTRRRAADARAAEANAANAADAGWRITRRPRGLDGWSANDATDMKWDTVDEAITEQAYDADRTRRHRAFREAMSAAITADGGSARFSRDPGRSTVMRVMLPPGHRLAPATGELVGGLVHSVTVRGWADAAEWWGQAAPQMPEDYPPDE